MHYGKSVSNRKVLNFAWEQKTTLTAGVPGPSQDAAMDAELCQRRGLSYVLFSLWALVWRLLCTCSTAGEPCRASMVTVIGNSGTMGQH